MKPSRTGVRDLPALPSNEHIVAITKNGRYYVRPPYRYRDKIASITSARWDGDRRAYEVQGRHAELLAERIEEIAALSERDMSARLTRRSEIQPTSTALAETISARLETELEGFPGIDVIDGRSVRFSFTFDERIYSAMKAMRSRFYDALSGTWTVHATTEQDVDIIVATAKSADRSKAIDWRTSSPGFSIMPIERSADRGDTWQLPNGEIVTGTNRQQPQLATDNTPGLPPCFRGSPCVRVYHRPATDDEIEDYRTHVGARLERLKAQRTLADAFVEIERNGSDDERPRSMLTEIARDDTLGQGHSIAVDGAGRLWALPTDRLQAPQRGRLRSIPASKAMIDGIENAVRCLGR